MFLETMESMGAGFSKYINIEPSKEGAKLTAQKGFAVFNSCVEDIILDFKVDAIMAFELIEHLFNPLTFVNKIESLLEDNGVFILTAPNIEGFDLALLGKNSDNIIAPNHLNYFNPRSIQILLEKSGFGIIHIETPGVLDLNIVENKVKDGIKINDRFISLSVIII